MDVLKRERFDKNKEILMVVPTRKTDREPHRWNIACHEKHFVDVQKCAMEVIQDFKNVVPEDPWKNSEIVAAIPLKDGNSVCSESERSESEETCDTMQQNLLDEHCANDDLDEAEQFRPVPATASTAHGTRKLHSLVASSSMTPSPTMETHHKQEIEKLQKMIK